MKKYIKISAIVLTGILLAISGNIQQAKAATSSNLFSTLLGKSETEVQARIDSVWTHFFTPGDISKYDADANEILHKVTSKDGKATGVYNLYDDSTRLPRRTLRQDSTPTIVSLMASLIAVPTSVTIPTAISMTPSAVR